MGVEWLAIYPFQVGIDVELNMFFKVDVRWIRKKTETS